MEITTIKEPLSRQVAFSKASQLSSAPQATHIVFSGLDKVRFGSTGPLENLFPKAGEIPPEADLPVYQGGTKVLINGTLTDWTGPTDKFYSPVMIRDGNGKKARLEKKFLGELPAMTKKEAQEALDAAYNAFDKGEGQWPMMSPAQRIQHMEQFVATIKPRVEIQNGNQVTVNGDTREQVVKLLMYEIGKTRGDAEKEFDRTIEYIELTIDAYKTLQNPIGQGLKKVFELFVETLKSALGLNTDPNAKTTGEYLQKTADAVKNLLWNTASYVKEGGKLKKEALTPQGVALCMGPFNYPLNETFTTLIPALLTGNTIICKLPKLGALSNTPLFEAFQKNFPKGVVNFLSGDGKELVSPIIKSGKVDILAFIGSQGVANSIMAQHPAPNRLNAVLGLSAKNPAIVLPDADIDKTVAECVKGALSYNGQRCTALKVMYVPRDKADEFANKLGAAVNKLKLGMPWQKGVDITPLPEDGKTGWMNDYVQDALHKGAKVVNPGGGTYAGTIFKPAVLYPVNPSMKIFQEEQFGPVIPVVPYDDIKEVKQYIKDSPYGQQASVFTRNFKSPEFKDLLGFLKNQVSRVNLNEQCMRGPDQFAFVGRKDSAKGVLSVEDALKIFTTPFLVTTPATPGNEKMMAELEI